MTGYEGKSESDNYQGTEENEETLSQLEETQEKDEEITQEEITNSSIHSSEERDVASIDLDEQNAINNLMLQDELDQEKL